MKRVYTLNKEGFRTHGGAQFQSNHILRILKNPIYCGYLKNGEATSARMYGKRSHEKTSKAED